VGAGVAGVDPRLVEAGADALVEEPPPPPQADNITSAAKALANRRIEGVRVGGEESDFIHWIIGCIQSTHDIQM
jgi:hypothetical protein